MKADHIKSVRLGGSVINYYADDEYIGRILSAEASYCADEIALVAKFIRPGDCIIEVGANIGTITLSLARAVGPNGKVFAVEPQKENFALLNRNVEENDLSNVTLCFGALGSIGGMDVAVPTLAELPHRNYGNVTLGSGSQRAPMRRLDDGFGDLDVAMIKIDAEGSEADIIRGGAALIKRCRPILHVENDRAEKSAELFRLIRSLDYRCFHHAPSIAPSTCNVQDNRGIFMRDIVAPSLVCVPTGRIEEFRSVTDDLRPAVPDKPRLGKSGWAGIARLGGIGDNLIAASVLRPLRSAGYRIDVITQMPQGVVFENNPFVDKLSMKGPKDLPGNQAEWLAWFRSRGNEYDVFANLSHSCEVSLAMLPSQTQSQWPSSTRRKYYGHNYLEFVHDVVGVPYEFGPLFFPTDEERDQAIVTKRKIGSGPVIGWPISGSRVDKLYPKAPTTIARLIKELGAQVILFGAPNNIDFPRAKQTQEYVIHQNGDDRGLHLAMSPDEKNPTWPIRRVLSQLHECDLVIGPDTGQMWAVAFEPMPKIMLHSHASIENICKHWIRTTSLHADRAAVPCWPCHMLHDSADSCLDEQRRHGMTPDADEKGAACIQTISVEAIIIAARTAINGRASYER